MRRVFPVLVVAVLTASLTTRASAQSADSNATIISLRRAYQVLQRGIEAMGGLEALQGVTSVTRRLDGRRTDIGQGMSPGRPSDAPNTLFIAADLRGRRVATATRATIQGGQPIRWRFAVTPAAAFNANLANGTIRTFPAPVLPNILAGLLRRWPESLLLAAADGRESLRYVGRERDGGRLVDVITFTEPTGGNPTVAFDVATGLPARVEGVLTEPVRGEGTIGIRFADWRRAGAVRLPWRYEEYMLGSAYQVWTAASIEINAAPADSLFVQPAGLVPVPPAGPSQPERLAEGVWLLPGSYTSLAIAFRDHVLVLEGGSGSGWTEGQMAQIRRLVPDKPIRYVVATHWHYDHVSGLRPYIAEGVTVVTTPDAAAVVRQVSRARLLLRPDALARHPRDPVVETVADRRVFEDDERRVELILVRGNPHVDQALVAWLPTERLLFQADLFDYAGARLTPGGEDTAHLADLIRRLNLAVDRVVSVHEGIAPRAALDSAVALRGTLGQP